MNNYSNATYGDRIASFFDQDTAPPDPQMIELLAGLASDGIALELGIGTGRVALPLVERGVHLEGIDTSAAMVEQLRAKPGGADIPVSLGSFAEVSCGADRFALIFAAQNTLLMLLTQDEQQRCFHLVAQQLRSGGTFVIESLILREEEYTPFPSLEVVEMEVDSLELEVSRYDKERQLVMIQRVMLSSAGTQFYPHVLRYASPVELDDMAATAGLSLRDRWVDWAGNPFRATSRKHISVYTRP